MYTLTLLENIDFVMWGTKMQNILEETLLPNLFLSILTFYR